MEKPNDYYFINLEDKRYKEKTPMRKTYLVSQSYLQELHKRLKDERIEKDVALVDYYSIMKHRNEEVKLFKAIQPSMLERMLMWFLEGRTDIKNHYWQLINEISGVEISDPITITDYRCKEPYGLGYAGCDKVTFRLCYAKENSKSAKMNGYYVFIDEMTDPYICLAPEFNEIKFSFNDFTVPEFVFTKGENKKVGMSYLGFFLGNKTFDETKNVGDRQIEKVNLFTVIREMAGEK